MNRVVFFLKVKRMRDAQRRFFAGRSDKARAEATALEKEIDAEIERVSKIMEAKVDIGNLFDQEG
jgi:hypothetical protein